MAYFSLTKLNSKVPSIFWKDMTPLFMTGFVVDLYYTFIDLPTDKTLHCFYNSVLP